MDVVENPAAELRGPVEALPVEDASFDVVLCTQVLEHCDDPAQAVRELRRVTAPGGRVLASTHGVQVYHPSPEDYWRWTHAGLRRLFTENAELAVGRRFAPARRHGACLAMLLGTYTEIAFRRARLPQLAAAPSGCSTGRPHALDRRVELLREPRAGLADGELPRRRDRRRLMRFFRRNALGIYAVYAAAIVSGLVVTPIVLHAIGDEAFGIWAFIGVDHDLPVGARPRRRAVDRPLRGGGARAARPGGDEPRRLGRARALRG